VRTIPNGNIKSKRFPGLFPPLVKHSRGGPKVPNKGMMNMAAIAVETNAYTFSENNSLASKQGNAKIQNPIAAILNVSVVLYGKSDPRSFLQYSLYEVMSR
jgi:hypothetical protein